MTGATGGFSDTYYSVSERRGVSSLLITGDALNTLAEHIISGMRPHLETAPAPTLEKLRAPDLDERTERLINDGVVIPVARVMQILEAAIAQDTPARELFIAAIADEVTTAAITNTLENTPARVVNPSFPEPANYYDHIQVLSQLVQARFDPDITHRATFVSVADADEIPPDHAPDITGAQVRELFSMLAGTHAIAAPPAPETGDSIGPRAPAAPVPKQIPGPQRNSGGQSPAT